MNIKLRYKIVLGLSFLAGIFLWGRCSKPIPLADPTPATVLPSNDREQIIVNPEKHQLIIVKPTGNETLTLPDRPSVIDIHHDGSVSVTSKQFGFEHKFFAGLQASDAVRFAAGMDGFYYKRLDLGMGIADKVGNYTPIVFGHVSYTVYDNLRLSVTYDSHQRIGALASLRI